MTYISNSNINAILGIFCLAILVTLTTDLLKKILLCPGAQPGFEKKGGRVFFERARQLQATTQIFIALETESHGFSEIETVFPPPKQVIFKKKGLHQN